MMFYDDVWDASCGSHGCQYDTGSSLQKEPQGRELPRIIDWDVAPSTNSP